jgi:hypothetical protein
LASVNATRQPSFQRIGPQRSEDARNLRLATMTSAGIWGS